MSHEKIPLVKIRFPNIYSIVDFNMTRITIFLLLALSYSSLPLLGEDITLRNGRILKDIKIYNHSEWDAMVSHSEGIENIDLKLFPKEIQDRLGYDADAAQAAREEQKKRFEEAKERRKQKEKAERRETEKRNEALEILRKIGRKAFEGHLEIQQVTRDGFMADGLLYRYPAKTITVYERQMVIRSKLDPSSGHYRNVPVKRTVRPNPETFDTWIFVTDPSPSSLSEGQEIERLIFPVGSFSYTNILNQERTVPKFTTNLFSLLSPKQLKKVLALEDDEILDAAWEGYYSKEKEN